LRLLQRISKENWGFLGSLNKGLGVVVLAGEYPA